MKPHVAEALEAQLATGTRRRAGPPIPDYDHLVLARGTLRTPDGDVPVKRIGKGMFSTVYREQGGAGRVFALSDDETYDKEIAAMVHDDLPDNRHVPAVERFGHTADKTVYAMPHYRAPLRKADSPSAWRDYRIVEKCHMAAESRFKPEDRGYPANVATVECAREDGASPGVVEALDGLASMAANYDYTYGMEFPRQNLATDLEGHLVLLDVLANRDAIRRVREERQRQQERNRRRW